MEQREKEETRKRNLLRGRKIRKQRIQKFRVTFRGKYSTLKMELCCRLEVPNIIITLPFKSIKA